MLDIQGVTMPIAVALGVAGVKTIEDLADLATDEIRGGFEQKGGERVRVPGALESFNLSVPDAENLILNARIAAGWIEAPVVEEVEEAYEEGDLAADADAELADLEVANEVEGGEADADATTEQ
ncbi:hypothetical protein MMA231_00144 [Asticcacaulis sp. MM231]